MFEKDGGRARLVSAIRAAEEGDLVCVCVLCVCHVRVLVRATFVLPKRVVWYVRYGWVSCVCTCACVCAWMDGSIKECV